MPHPSRITLAAVRREAAALLEKQGEEGLSMRELARRLGVRAPSLYFHVQGRDDLLRLLITDGLEELGAAQRRAFESAPGDPRSQLHRLGDAYIEFAFAAPRRFGLIFGPCPEERLAEEAVVAAATVPLLEAISALVPPEQVLDIAQAVWSLVHGYVTLALSDQFRMGGDPRGAFHRAIDLLLAGLGAMDVTRP